MSREPFARPDVLRRAKRLFGGDPQAVTSGRWRTLALSRTAPTRAWSGVLGGPLVSVDCRCTRWVTVATGRTWRDVWGRALAYRRAMMGAEVKTGSPGRFPYIRVTVEGDGNMRVVVCRNRSEYSGPNRPSVQAHLSPNAAAKLVKALRKLLPEARKEKRARQWRGRYAKKHGEYHR